VIVDAAATGHIVAQLGAADAIRELVDVGPLRNQTQWVSDIVADPAITAVNIVTTPEEMPVAETIELVERLRDEVNVPLGTVVVNRVLPELFTHADEETFEALRAPEPAQLLTSAAGRGATEVLDAARLAVSLRRTRAEHLEHLLATVDLPLLYVPYLFVRAHGLRVTRMVAEALGEELG
jgi:anion-transporting  ArsA/GET3 family ATPase